MMGFDKKKEVTQYPPKVGVEKTNRLNTLKAIHGDQAWLFRKKTIKCGNIKLLINLPKLCDLIVENRDGIVEIGKEYSIYDRYKLTKVISNNLNKFLKVIE